MYWNIYGEFKNIFYGYGEDFMAKKSFYSFLFYFSQF